MRGIAIVLVLTCHWLWTGADSLRFTAVGAAGVTVFFTLSGYLITAQLLREHAVTGRLSLRGFYARRVRRLAPALLALLAVVGVVEAASGARLAPLLPTLFFFANWRAAAGTSIGVLNPTWSLSIEEQFYLVWPAALLVALRFRRGALAVTIAGIAVSTGLRFWFGAGAHGDARAYYGTDTQAASLLVGCLLAMLMARGLRPVRVPSWAVTAVVVSLFGWLLVPSAATGRILVPTLVPWVAAALILAATGSPGSLLSTRPLRYLGRRSYGIYLWHYPLVVAVGAATEGSWVWCLAAVLVSVGVAEISWRMVEHPFLERGTAPRPASRVPARGQRGPDWAPWTTSP